MELVIDRCHVCGRPIQRPRRGRRLYCSEACKQKAKRARGPRSLPPGAVPEPGPEPVAALLVGREAPPDEQLVALIHETILLVVSYRRLSLELRRAFAWRALAMADGIDELLARYFRERAS